MTLKKAIIALISLFVISPCIMADEMTSNTDSIFIQEETPIEVDDILIAKYDSLVSQWAISARMVVDSSCTTRKSHCSPLPDSVYIERLKSITNEIEMPFSREVKAFIELYTGRRRVMVERILGLSQYYFPIIEQALDAESLPLELKYIAILESALNPKAVSNVGATGLWQFMLPTGKAFGLEVSTMIDERRDPIKSTTAAVKMLKELYRIYGDWNLTLAAYNCGPGNLNKAIRRSGGKRDYWAIYNQLPKGTREYIPLFISLNYIMNFHKEHEICPSISPIALDMDTIHINRRVHFEQIADLLDVSVEELRAYNPQYKRDIIPGNQKEYSLRLPFNLMQSYIVSEDSIYKHRANELLANHRVTVRPGAGNTPGGNTNIASGDIYTVRSGDNLGSIAKRHGTTVSKIKTLNNLTSDKLSIGQKLAVRETASVNTNQASTTNNSSTRSIKQVDNNDIMEPSRYYTVQSGDSFWNIAKKTQTTVQRLLQANNMHERSKLQPGQKLIIPQG
ncbi:MAG: LysM peptidoglycan-binding domain-containing protein [Bacteroidales bacterium]